MQAGHSEVKWKSAIAKSKKSNCRIVLAHTIASQLTNSQLESRAMTDILQSPKADSAPASDSSRLFDWPRQITNAERKSLLAGGLGWMLDAMDVMLYSLVITYLIREFSMDTRTAGFLNSLTLVLASAIGGLLFRNRGRPHRAHAFLDGL